MKIDCHCHVFNNDCIPVKGLLQSRFGFAVGSRLIGHVNSSQEDRTIPHGDELRRHLTLDLASLRDSLTNPAEKDNIRYLLAHPYDFVRFAVIGRKNMADIVAGIMKKAKNIDIWIPLMMDTEKGFEGSASLVGFDGQKRIMMDLTAAARGRIWPFFAYDPRSRPVDAVKNAIEREGFVGVKLYPPLGFKPCDNEDGEVNDRLEGLYRYCVAARNGPIPITAHCSWSDGVFSNRAIPGIRAYKEYYRDMAHPSHWEKVLARYGNLKLNFAHFGGAGEWEQRALGGPSAAVDKNWVDTILRLMRGHENVYADLSFHGILTAKNGDAYRRALLEKIAGVETRILLGSDWYMSAIQCDLADYWRNFETLFPDLFDPMTGPNALRFLRSEASEAFLPAFLASRAGYDGQFFDLFNKS
jgi:predicted TIM-barrel fold metal-dependent hydrolase